MHCESLYKVRTNAPLPAGFSRAEEAGTELPVREAHLRKCLGDGRLPGSDETVEPGHVLVLVCRLTSIRAGRGCLSWVLSKTREGSMQGRVNAPLRTQPAAGTYSQRLHLQKTARTRRVSMGCCLSVGRW